MLVFAQLKSLLELVETDVLQPGGISFLRLDGRSDILRVSHVYFVMQLGGKEAFQQSADFLLHVSHVLHALLIMQYVCRDAKLCRINPFSIAWITCVICNAVWRQRRSPASAIFLLHLLC